LRIKNGIQTEKPEVQLEPSGNACNIGTFNAHL
jgi:hypothetical protein